MRNTEMAINPELRNFIIRTLEDNNIFSDVED